MNRQLSSQVSTLLLLKTIHNQKAVKILAFHTHENNLDCSLLMMISGINKEFITEAMVNTSLTDP
jgi:hypothetical protein